MNKITTALLAALVLTQVPSAVESLHSTTCISNAKSAMNRHRPSWDKPYVQSRAVAFCNSGERLW